MKTVKELKDRGCLRGDATLEEVLNPLIEQEDADSEEITFQDGEAGVAEIVSLVKRREAISKGELVIEKDEESDDDDDDEEEPSRPELTNAEIIELCEKLEFACLDKPDLSCNIELAHNLRVFRAHARKDQFQNAKQTSIDTYFAPSK